MKKLLCSTIFSILLFPFFPVHAEEIADSFDVSANIGFFSQYSFRGVSQSNEEPSMQGGFDVAHSSGLYAGAWGSNINFDDGDEGHLEVDLYAGYASSIDNFDYDIGIIYYAYPGANSQLDYDFWEAAGIVGYDFDTFALSASINYSPEFFGNTGDAFYYSAVIDVPLPQGFTLSGHVGHQQIDEGQDYVDWSVGLGYTLAGFDVSLQYEDTDLSEPEECTDGCGSKVVFGISKTF